jgi:hypothetical protein
MNVLVNRMVDQGLIDESAARGISGLLAEGEPPSRAFTTCGVADDVLLRFLAKELGVFEGVPRPVPRPHPPG